MPHSDEWDTVGPFSDRVADYVKYRPTYPAEALRAILAGLGPPERLVAADVGAGTGISARLLGDEGVRVVAVEPGEGMRRAARSASYVPKTGAAGERMLVLLHALHTHYADAKGFVTMVYETEIFCSKKL